MERHRVGIVIPAYAEEKTIAGVVASAAAYGSPIVVDDGSWDATGRFAADAGAHVIRHSINKGYDEALNSGFAYAASIGVEYIITMDADGQHDPMILKYFIRELETGADIVVGDRDRRQRMAEQLFAWVATAKWGINDPLCGMKAYRMSLFHELGHFDSYSSIGTELALFAARKGKRIAQIPVKTRNRADSPRFGKRYSANKRILRALWIGLFQSTN